MTIINLKKIKEEWNISINIYDIKKQYEELTNEEKGKFRKEISDRYALLTNEEDNSLYENVTWIYEKKKAIIYYSKREQDQDILKSLKKELEDKLVVIRMLRTELDMLYDILISCN